MSANETMNVSETGASKAGNLERHSLLAPSLRELAEHYGRGSLKYADHNWRKGMAWSLLFDAMMRHAWEFWNGNDYDDGDGGTGSKHIIATAWHALALATFMDEHPDLDDRPMAPVNVGPFDIVDTMDDPDTDEEPYGRHARRGDVWDVGPDSDPVVIWLESFNGGSGYFAKLHWWSVEPTGSAPTLLAWGAPHISVIE